MALAAPAVAFVMAVAAAGASNAAQLAAKARAAYDDVRLRDAAVLFREAADAASSDDERASALLWAGVAAGQAGELGIARRAFDDALRVRCAAALPTTVSPKVQSVFAAALGVQWPDGCPPLEAPAPDETTVPPAASTTTPTTPTTSTTPTAATPTTASGTMSPLGLGFVGVGGVALGVAGGVALKGVADITTAADARTPQVDARARLDDGNLALGIAAVTAVVGATALVAGAVLLGGGP